MVWNKTEESKIKLILNECLITDNTNKVIAEKFNCSDWLVGELCRKYLTKEQRKDRWTRLASSSKRGNDNPMYGKKGLSHHNAVTTEVRSSGYKTIFPPKWWTGSTPKGRVGEHILIWAESTGNTFIPKGHVIHHIDGNINNNIPENLQLLTISEHIKLHWRQRKVQRLESNLVGDSVSEAQGNLKG